MRKRDTLQKIAYDNIFNKKAHWIGDAKNILKKMRSEGIFLDRNTGRTSSYSASADSNSNKIHKEISIATRGKNPVTDLAHEFGHSRVFKKKRDTSKKNIIKYNKDLNTHPTRSNALQLKDERQANQTALNFISEKKDRKKYIENTKDYYQTYKDDFQRSYGNNKYEYKDNRDFKLKKRENVADKAFNKKHYSNA
jgi:hypothetical protein